MATVTTTYDVFISHAAVDKNAARIVAESLEAAGLTTFYLGVIEGNENLGEAVWEALSESHAVIAVLSAESLNNANVMLELGAASAWSKPVYLVVTDPKLRNPFGMLAKYPTYSLSRIDDIVLAIRNSFERLTEDESEVLTEVYRDVGVPTDQLSLSSRSLHEISSRFEEKTNKKYAGERLLYELLRLRKRGRLPRLAIGRR